MRIGRYLRISNKEQRKGLDRQLFQLERCVLEMGGELEDSPLYVDVLSGRNRSRPEFQKMYRDIEARTVDAIVAYRVDRLARDLEVSANLFRLFESTGVRLYDFQKMGYVDFSNPEEWESYAQRAVSAEGESRKLSKRIKSGYEYSRHLSKAGSKPPWGYIRNKETERYELDPELEKAVRDSVATIVRTGNFQRACRQIAKRWGKQWQPNSLRKWISNPVLRGHTGYDRQGRSWGEVKRDTHPEHAIISESEYQAIEELIAERRMYWGANYKREQRHPLGGLAFCGRCGTKMCITAGGDDDNEDKIFYFSCRERVHRIKPGEICTLNRSLRVNLLESAVISQLVQAAEAIVDVAETPIEPVKPPRLVELEALLTNLNRLGNDPALQASKSQLRTEIASIQAAMVTPQLEGFSENKALLLSIFGEPLFWQTMKPPEKRVAFTSLIERIVIDVAEVDTGETSRRGRPKLRLDWSIQMELKPALQARYQVPTVQISCAPRGSPCKPPGNPESNSGDIQT
ncbi:MAG: recombinase family protein [Pegethrix bostrychoides GSE-TBD4-15B]|jgi:DNA invertase Pin-like site-specific DNA recombinase|uniref:Recombinase family protein n=1 Tax=Pegethrix bostrychoides GSE-TBD4-15B TaxID=2839662 RepID=A0A951P8E5_9CYAN|nr:recombinase family protein [Pegethrix bostrychoides GSE-TBD4-15B]